MYTFAIPAIIVRFSLSESQAGFIGTCALLVSAVGGWIAGVLADRLGRVRLLQITILWFAFFTCLCGLARSYHQLLILRSLQGFGMGGEWAAGAVLMGEVVSPAHRGRAVGTVQGGWAVGWGMAALISTLLFNWLPARLAWRAVFVVGILPAFAVFLVRRLVDEPEVFEKTRREIKDRGSASSALEIFSQPLLVSTILGALLALGAQGGYYAIATWLPTFLQTERHLTVLTSGAYMGVIILGSFLGYLSGAWLTDLLGRRRNFLLFSFASLGVILIYTQIIVSDSTMLFLGFPLGFFASGVFSGMGPLFTELFPTRVRANGHGFCYNFGRGLAATFPFLVGYMTRHMPLGRAIGLFAAGAYAIVVVAAFALPETRGRELE